MRPHLSRLIRLSMFCLILFGGQALAAVNIQRVTSPGGIEAWLVEQHTIPLIAVDFAFRGGSKLDPEDKVGLSRLAAALIDEGAGDLDSQAFQKRLEELAIKLGFQADHDAFHGSLQTLTENSAEAFRLTRLALTAPRFDPEPVARIKAQLLSNLQQSQEDPDAIASKAWFAAAFPDHPYGRPSEGEASHIERISADDLRGFTARQIARDRLVIAVVGDIDAARLGQLLDETFGALPKSAVAAEKPLIRAAVNKTLVIKRDIPQTVMIFGLPGMLRSDPDFIPAYVMNYILGGGGFNSRLMVEIREKRGLAYSVTSQLAPLEQAGLFLGGVATQNERANETVALLRQELGRMRDEGVTPQELEDAKTYLIGSFPLRFDSNSKISEQLLSYQMENLGIDYLQKRNDLMRAVTREDVNRVAKRLLDPDNLLLVSVGQPNGAPQGK